MQDQLSISFGTLRTTQTRTIQIINSIILIPKTGLDTTIKGYWHTFKSKMLHLFCVKTVPMKRTFAPRSLQI